MPPRKPKTLLTQKLDDRDTNQDGTVSPEERETAWATNPKNPNYIPPRTQSGDDWGMEGDDFWNDYFGTDLANMNPHETVTTTTPATTTTNTGGKGDTPNPFGSSTTLLDKNPTLITTTTDTGNPNPALAAGIKADTDKGPPKLPEESNYANWSNWSPDYTDSGFETDVDLEDTLEEETEEAGYIPNQPQTPLYSIDSSGLVTKNLLTGDSKRKGKAGFGAGASTFASMNASANPNAQRRAIRAKRTLISGAR